MYVMINFFFSMWAPGFETLLTKYDAQIFGRENISSHVIQPSVYQFFI